MRAWIIGLGLALGVGPALAQQAPRLDERALTLMENECHNREAQVTSTAFGLQDQVLALQAKVKELEAKLAAQTPKHANGWDWDWH